MKNEVNSIIKKYLNYKISSNTKLKDKDDIFVKYRSLVDELIQELLKSSTSDYHYLMKK